MSIIKSSSRRLRRFEKRGNVAIMFALVASLSMALMGGTVE
jgi:Flp pilus assembly protein TadG